MTSAGTAKTGKPATPSHAVETDQITDIHDELHPTAERNRSNPPLPAGIVNRGRIKPPGAQPAPSARYRLSVNRRQPIPLPPPDATDQEKRRLHFMPAGPARSRHLGKEYLVVATRSLHFCCRHPPPFEMSVRRPRGMRFFPADTGAKSNGFRKTREQRTGAEFDMIGTITPRAEGSMKLPQAPHLPPFPCRHIFESGFDGWASPPAPVAGQGAQPCLPMAGPLLPE